MIVLQVSEFELVRSFHASHLEYKQSQGEYQDYLVRLYLVQQAIYLLRLAYLELGIILLLHFLHHFEGAHFVEARVTGRTFQD